MIIESLQFEDKVINISSYEKRANNTIYTYYRSRFILNGVKHTIESSSLDSCRKKINHLFDIYSYTNSSLNSNTLFPEAIDKWLTMRWSQARPETYRTYKGRIDCHLIPFFFSYRVCNIKPKDVQRLIDMLNTKLSPVTVRAIFHLLSSFLQEYVDCREIAYNPCTNARLPTTNTAEVEPLTKQEVVALFHALETSGFKDLFSFALLTGMRIREILGLTWDNVDFGRRTIYICQQLYRDKELVPYVKNSNPQKVTFPDEVFQLLMEAKQIQKRQQDANGSSFNNELNLVYTNDFGKPLVCTTVRKRFKQAAKEIGKDHLRIHDLRHTLLTEIWEKSHDITQVMTVSRHKNPLGLKPYLHQTQEGRLKAAQLISEVAVSLSLKRNLPDQFPFTNDI